MSRQVWTADKITVTRNSLRHKLWLALLCSTMFRFRVQVLGSRAQQKAASLKLLPVSAAGLTGGLGHGWSYISIFCTTVFPGKPQQQNPSCQEALYRYVISQHTSNNEAGTFSCRLINIDAVHACLTSSSLLAGSCSSLAAGGGRSSSPPTAPPTSTHPAPTALAADGGVAATAVAR